MKNDCNSCGGYPNPVVNDIDPKSIITFYNGCKFIGMTAEDFITSAQLGLFDNLSDYANGDILMVNDGILVPSGLSFETDLNALVYDGKIIADEVEVSTETIQLSQRVKISTFGTEPSFESEFDDKKSLPVYTKYDDTGSLGNFAQIIGSKTEVALQPDDSATFTGSRYTPPTTTGQSLNNVLRGAYRFAEAGINARISVTAENEDGDSLILFGTESYPFAEFVTSEGDTIVEYPGTIANVPGLVYTTVIGTYDPETKEQSNVALNIKGSNSSGLFRAYLTVDVQARTEVELAGTGDVIGVGTSQIGDLVAYADATGKTIQTTNVKIDDLVLKTDPLNKQSTIITANTVDIYQPDDIYNRFFYKGLTSATVKLKNPKNIKSI